MDLDKIIKYNQEISKTVFDIWSMINKKWNTARI